MAVTEISGVTRIAKPHWLVIGFAAFACVVAMFLVLPHVSKNPPALAACLGVIGVLTTCAVVRAWRDGLRIDSQGLTVRSFFHRRHKVGWAEVSRLSDGSISVYGAEGVRAPAPMWVLLIVLHNGRVIKARPTAAWPGERHTRILTAISQAAARYGVPAELTGSA